MYLAAYVLSSKKLKNLVLSASMLIDDSCPLSCKSHRESKGERRYIYAISFLVKDQALIKGGFFLPDLEPLSLTTKAMYCRRQEVVVVVPNMELITQQQRSFA